jgi:GTPase SAR1 family protein
MSLAFLKKQPTPQEVKTEVRQAIAQMAEDNKLLDQPDSEVIPDLSDIAEDSEHTGRVSAASKLSKLIDEDFPFDESQIAAVEGMVAVPYACLTGAAGTGKTTVTKKLVDRLLETVAIGAVDLTRYWKTKDDDGNEYESNDYEQHGYVDDEDYEITESIIPSVALCSFTGRASQQIKGNFPRDWHGNIMTIHRLLGFYPEPYQEWDPDYRNDETGEEGKFVTKRRFVPTYTADFKLPWDVIGIDEAGMLGVDLWHQLFDAMKPGCRIYFIGDINQLPPVHGKSIFGFAMAKLPAFELTHVHRQQGKDNPIVDNAWRVIHGQMPVSGGRFQMIKVDGDAQLVSRKVRAMMPKLQSMEIYDPIRDTIITPINGEDGAKGYALGQLPLNREFALMFNPANVNPRYIIDGGRVKQRFAVGDKVMATKNDWEAGITNGMTGIITSIAEHGGYMGDIDRYGPIHEVTERMKAAETDLQETELLDINALSDSFLAIEEGNKNKKEKRERGPASHIVTVRFGNGEHSFEIPFSTLAEVGSLMTAYVVTCHKMQGGESPTIVIIVHDAHRAMLYREWLYTAITRASEKCILIYTESALKIALNKQNIKGRTLKEKVASFNALMNAKDSFDATARAVRLPEFESSALTIMDRDEKQVMTPARLTTDSEKQGGLASLVSKHRIKIESKVEVKHVHVHIHHQSDSDRVNPTPTREVDGGELKPQPVAEPIRSQLPDSSGPVARSLRVPVREPHKLVSQHGAVRMALFLSNAVESKLLTYQPQPETPSVPETKKSGLGFLMKKKV